MTRKEIINMAREAGFETDPKFGIWVTDGYWDDEFMRFAALVAAAEREACINIIETYRIPVGNSSAGEMAFKFTYDALYQIRDDIRARGQE